MTFDGGIESNEAIWLRNMSRDIDRLLACRENFVRWLAFEHGLNLSEWEFHLDTMRFVRRDSAKQADRLD